MGIYPVLSGTAYGLKFDLSLFDNIRDQTNQSKKINLIYKEYRLDQAVHIKSLSQYDNKNKSNQV